jgi:hypothetical protein
MNEEDDEPKTWVSALKIILGIAALIGAVWFALWYAGQRPVRSPALEQAIEEVHQKSSGNPSSSSKSWGIAKDSPLGR